METNADLLRNLYDKLKQGNKGGALSNERVAFQKWLKENTGTRVLEDGRKVRVWSTGPNKGEEIKYDTKKIPSFASMITLGVNKSTKDVQRLPAAIKRKFFRDYYGTETPYEDFNYLKEVEASKKKFEVQRSDSIRRKASAVDYEGKNIYEQEVDVRETKDQKRLNELKKGTSFYRAFPTEEKLVGLDSTEYVIDEEADDYFNPFEINSEEKPNFGFEKIDESLLSPSNTTEAQIEQNLKQNKVDYDKKPPGDDTSSAAVESNDPKNEVTNKEQLKSTAIPKPWARKWAGGDGRSLSDVNAETEAALEARGFNMDSNKSRLLFSKRGYSKNQLLADVRTGRASLDKDRLFANGQVLKIGE